MSSHRTAVIYPVENDIQSVILYEELMNRGAKPLMIPFGLKPEHEDSNILIDESSFRLNGEISQVRAVYLRGLSVNVPSMLPPFINRLEYLAWQAKFMKENIKVNFWLTLLKSLELSGTLVVNNINTYLHHYSKMQMFDLLRKNRLPAPFTFATNDLDFLARNMKKRMLVMKSSTGIGATVLVDNDILDKERQLLQAPALFQEYIEGSTVRVHTVAGKVVLALKIYSTDTDSRTDTEGFEFVELPPRHTQAISRANTLLGARFSAWDVIIDKKNKLYLLDCNPGPYIGWIGPAFTRIVMSGLADFMSAYARGCSLEESEKAIVIRKPDIDRVLKTDHSALPFVHNKKEAFKEVLGLRH